MLFAALSVAAKISSTNKLVAAFGAEESL
jgi:hypothetical protein